MSIFSDFQRVWQSRFPNQSLPLDWEEEVRSNLHKHQQKVQQLKDELAKEEFYVEYLDRLLSDFQTSRKNIAKPSAPVLDSIEPSKNHSERVRNRVRNRVGSMENTDGGDENSGGGFNDNDIDDVLNDIDSSSDIDLDMDNENENVSEQHKKADHSVNQCINELSFTLKKNDAGFLHTASPKPGPTNAMPSLNTTEKDRSAFVTVIEVSELKQNQRDSHKKQQLSRRTPLKKKSSFDHFNEIDTKSTSSSVNSPVPDESGHYYDSVPSDSHFGGPATSASHPLPSDFVAQNNRGCSSTDDKSSTSSTLPLTTKHSNNSSLGSVTGEPESPGRSSDYVNIDFFIQRKLSMDNNSSDGELDDVSSPSQLTHNDDNSSALFGSANSLEFSTPIAERKRALLNSVGRVTGGGMTPTNPNSSRMNNFVGNNNGGGGGGGGSGGNNKESDYVDNNCSNASSASDNGVVISSMFKSIVSNIIESETCYVEYLHLLTQVRSVFGDFIWLSISHMKAIKATLSTSQPVISEDDFNAIFYKIPDLYDLHSNFLNSLKKRVQNNCKNIGECFKLLASNLILYGAFLNKYGRATETVRKCSMSNPQFAEISQNIKCKFVQNQNAVTFEDLLYKPVARVQKNALELHDLIKFMPSSHPDFLVLNEALEMTQAFLDEFNMIQTKNLFPANDKTQRRLIKNSFIVELVDGQRKLRHLFLFNDVIACAKYKTSRSDKYTFELKWFIHVPDIIVVPIDDDNATQEPRETNPANIVALKTQAYTVRDQILHDERQRNSSTGSNMQITGSGGGCGPSDDKKPPSGSIGGSASSPSAVQAHQPHRNAIKCEKQKKKLHELEAQLVLASPNLIFRLKSRATGSNRMHTFFMSSEFERMQWAETISALQQSYIAHAAAQAASVNGGGSSSGNGSSTTASSATSSTNTVSMLELQNWITACRNFLKTNMGSYLLRTGREEGLLVGDLYVTVKDLTNIEFPIDIYVCLEVDSYGHYFRKAKSKMVCKTVHPQWNESFVLDLEGSENLRILLYRDDDTNANNLCTYSNSPVCLFGKYVLKLSRQWLYPQQTVDKTLAINNCSLSITLKFVPSELTLRRVPVAKPGALFGAKIQQVCKRQKRDVPFIITSCIREVERRGVKEVGVYRVSGSASDLGRLKKSFETNSYEAEQLLKEVDIHSVTGVLKLYLRELPEALFTDHLYQQLFEAYNTTNNNHKQRLLMLQDCFSKLPAQNKQCILHILNHLIKVNQFEADNKMSLNNLATVFGPTLLRPSSKIDNQKQHDKLVSGTFDVISQAGILFCFLELVQQQNGLLGELCSS